MFTVWQRKKKNGLTCINDKEKKIKIKYRKTKLSSCLDVKLKPMIWIENGITMHLCGENYLNPKCDTEFPNEKTKFGANIRSKNMKKMCNVCIDVFKFSNYCMKILFSIHIRMRAANTTTPIQ